jgi:chromosome partitioning protein
VTTYAPETLQALSFREIGGTLDSYLEQNSAPAVIPADEEFVFEDFISEVSVARNANDNGARKGLYDLLPKKPHRPR